MQETKQCPKCLLEKPITDFYSSKGRKIFSWCKPCLLSSQKRRWRERKFQAIKLMGGKCSFCGYNKCPNAFDFHHLDPNEKEFDWTKLRLRTWKTIVEELKKCILLCANCHREAHAVQDENLELSGLDNSLLNQGIKSTGVCPSCQSPSYGTKYCSKECSHLSYRKVARPTLNELKNLTDTKSYCEIGRMYGVSDNAVRKWAKLYGILI